MIPWRLSEPDCHRWHWCWSRFHWRSPPSHPCSLSPVIAVMIWMQSLIWCIYRWIGKESWPTTCTGFPDAVSLRSSSAEASAPFPFTCCPLLPFCALWARFRFGFQRSQDLKCKENLTSVLFILFCKSGLLCLCNLHNLNSCVTSQSLKNCKSCLKKIVKRELDEIQAVQISIPFNLLTAIGLWSQV